MVGYLCVSPAIDWQSALGVSVLFCTPQSPGGVIELKRFCCIYRAHDCDLCCLLLFHPRRDGKSLVRFLEDYFANRLKRYIKSEPVPEINDGPVKVCTQSYCVFD